MNLQKVGSLLAVAMHRESALREVKERLEAVRHVVMTTHVNADGDGTGSQAAVGAWLAEKGIGATVVNPTPFPEQYRFLLHPRTRVLDWGAHGAEEVVRGTELLLILDTGEPSRIGPLAGMVAREGTLVIDHHPPGPATLADRGIFDATASATGELVYDLLRLDDEPLPEAALLGIYVALVTDTGSFRYSNTTPRTHVIAADLLARGVDPELVYQRIYATVPRRRVELLREALGSLEHDADHRLSWIVVPHSLIARLQATPEDLDGLVEYARSLEGTEVALLFRETPEAGTKISFRSNGRVDVNRIARQFAGGGHVKAAGATLAEPPQRAVPEVLAAARTALRGMKNDE
jgi:bifunctional oligoribonuclease and PAP phosphatase NrnA